MSQIKETETTDEVIREIRRIKLALAASMDFDVDRILQDARDKQKKSGKKVLSPPIREDA